MKKIVSFFTFLSLLLVAAGCGEISGPKKPESLNIILPPGPSPVHNPTPPQPHLLTEGVEISGHDFGEIALKDSRVGYLNIKNSGDKPIENMRLSGPYYPFLYEGFIYPGTTGTCGTTLAPGDSCTVAIKVGPSFTIGPLTENCEFSYDVDGKTIFEKITLTGEVKENAKLLAHDIDFGEVSKGDTVTKRLELKNSGSASKIKNIKFVQQAGSRITLKKVMRCDTLFSFSTCYVDVKFDANDLMDLDEEVEITYDIGSDSKREKIKVSATVQDLGLIKIDGHNFGNVSAKFNDKGEITVTITKLAAGPKISNLAIDTKTPTLVKGGFSICTWRDLYNKDDSCTFIINTANNVTGDLPIHQKIELTYDVNGVKKTADFTVTGMFQVKGLEIDGLDFGTVVTPVGGKTSLKLVITNPLDSSLRSVSKIDLTGLAGSMFDLEKDASKSTCLSSFNYLFQGDSCNLVLNVKPTASQTNLTQAATLTFRDSSFTYQNIPITFQGDVQVSTTMLAQYVTVTGESFGTKNFTLGDSFDVSLTVKNNSATDSAKALRIDRDIYPWEPNYFVQLEPTNTTCKASTNLNPGQTCEFVLRFKPNREDFFSKPFFIEYTDSTGALQTIKFDLNGSFKFNVGVVAPQAGSQPQKIISTKAGDLHYSYDKRPLKSSLTVNNPYPQSVLDKIPTMTHLKVDHVPWSFSVPAPDSPTKLTDIVPDRRKDPVTNKEYVVLYHGTTADLADTFMQGANVIQFGSAINTTSAYGTGFYLAADPNESKDYACDRILARKGKPGAPANLRGMLIVVGVEVDPKIQGKWSSFVLSDATGAPTYADIYFRRTDVGWNQFVFFSNIKPYLKIFDVIELGQYFGKADNLTDGDGLDITDTSRDNKSSNKCQH